MKRCIVLFLSLVFVFSLGCPVLAAGAGEVIYSDAYFLENGIRVVDTITVYSNSRIDAVSAERDKNLYDGDTLIAHIRFEAAFRYDGYNVSVLYKTVTHTDTYNGWNYVQNSFTDSGGTVTLDAKLTKLLIFNIPFTMTLSCDENGNISHS